MMCMPRRFVAGIPAILIALSCATDGPTGARRSAYPASIQIVSGNGQSTVVATQLPDPVVVRVVDSSGAHVRAQLVNFRVVSGGGSVFAGASITNDSGVVSERWTLGTSTADSQRLEARAVDNNTGEPIVFAVFRAIALPGPATQLALTTQPAATASNGVPLIPQPAVDVQDRFGNSVDTVGVSVSATVASGPSGALLTNAQTTTNDSGKARFTSLALVGTGGSYNLRFDAPGLGPAMSTPVALAASLVALSAGIEHTCALTPGGAAICWGDNSRAQLGDGTFIDRPTPVPAATNLALSAVGASFYHSCAVTRTGSAYCWGSNQDGRLGDGTTTDSPNPTPVSGAHIFTVLSPGVEHTCGLTNQDLGYCWGRNPFGVLGDGSTANRANPTPVVGAAAYSRLATKYYHTCALLLTGIAECWGRNTEGQLGDSTNTDRLAPTPVAGGLTFVSIAVGYEHTCGVTSAGAAYCWGYNADGQLGNSTTTNTSSPAPVAGGLTFASVVAGFHHTCGLTPAGVAFCWGRNLRSQLGVGVTGASLVREVSPRAVAGAMTFTGLTAGEDHACGLTASGAAYCWGSNSQGQLGNGTLAESASPTAVRYP